MTDHRRRSTPLAPEQSTERFDTNNKSFEGSLRLKLAGGRDESHGSEPEREDEK